MPFDCLYYPSVMMMKCNGDDKLLILQENSYFRLNIYIHHLESTIERIIWIGFYKNAENKKCLIKTLPKDLIMYILDLLGKQTIKTPYIKIP